MDTNVWRVVAVYPDGSGWQSFHADVDLAHDIADEAEREGASVSVSEREGVPGTVIHDV